MFVETEKRPVGEPAKVGALKVSEAIRIGAKIRGQCQGTYFDDGKSCAIGAALEGLGFTYGDDSEANKVVKMLGSERFRSAYWKNDRDGWSREKIADWLESQGF